MVLIYPGLCDALASALVVLALSSWLGGRRMVALALCCGAALTRETTLIVPAVLAVYELWHGRRVRQVLSWAVAPLCYLGWLGVIWIRLHAMPNDRPGALAPPFAGVLEVVHDGWTISGVLSALTLTALFGAAFVVSRSRRYYPSVLLGVVVASIGLVACAGSLVWAAWDGVARAVLPAEIIAFVMLLPAGSVRSRTRARSGEPRWGAPT